MWLWALLHLKSAFWKIRTGGNRNSGDGTGVGPPVLQFADDATFVIEVST